MKLRIKDDSIVQNHLVHFFENAPRESDPSGSKTRVPESVSREPQIRKSSRGHIPQCHFDVEGEVFLIASQDEEEPNFVQEVLSGPVKKNVKRQWKKKLSQ